jgi:hypothetical protein
MVGRGVSSCLRIRWVRLGMVSEWGPGGLKVYLWQ